MSQNMGGGGNFGLLQKSRIFEEYTYVNILSVLKPSMQKAEL